jgi:hypothetical protein
MSSLPVQGLLREGPLGRADRTRPRDPLRRHAHAHAQVFGAIVRRPQLNPIWLPRILIHPNADLRKLVSRSRQGRYGSAPNPEKGDASVSSSKQKPTLRPSRRRSRGPMKAPERSTAEAKQVAAVCRDLLPAPVGYRNRCRGIVGRRSSQDLRFRRARARSGHRIYRRRVRRVVAAPRPGPRWEGGNRLLRERCPVAGYAPTGSFCRVTTHLPRNDA